MRRFTGIFGWPLERTLSPAIHQAAFRRLDLDWVYLEFPVPPENLAEAIAGLRALGGVGANVTMPHKQTVMEHLDELSGDAVSVGAVNTIHNVAGRLIGHNTDVEGFSEFVTGDAGLDVAGAQCLVLGGGGAARAVVRSLIDLGAESIAVIARDQERVRELSSWGDRVDLSGAWSERFERAAGADLVINATPVGADDDDPLAGAAFAPGQAVVDLIYDPPTTPLVERARAAGAAGWTGLGMLVHQAAGSLRIWTGQDPPIEAMSVAAMHALTRR